MMVRTNACTIRWMTEDAAAAGATGAAGAAEVAAAAVAAAAAAVSASAADPVATRRQAAGGIASCGGEQVAGLSAAGALCRCRDASPLLQGGSKPATQLRDTHVGLVLQCLNAGVAELGRHKQAAVPLCSSRVDEFDDFPSAGI